MDIHILGTISAAFAAFVFGWVWYSDALFGKTWRKLAGVSDELHQQMAANKAIMIRTMILYFASLLLLGGCISYLLTMLNISMLGDALALAFCLWVGIAVPASIGSVLWERRPWSFYGINIFYILIAMLLAAGVLVWMM